MILFCLCKPVCTCVYMIVYAHAGALQPTLLLEFLDNLYVHMDFPSISVFAVYSHVAD